MTTQIDVFADVVQNRSYLQQESVSRRQSVQWDHSVE